ncbi:Cytokinin riboside 5'-monophosphate phosphoribohydrolase LOG7 [Hibiscus syriacus]|uniref:cytokinin riboside 5'-monophosphate phosphoribohydrolase n=1 Tax=Hibiscus syriacus TaxID=106335 RepID=A0A6A2Y8K9_HIBSY|nr:Cytokinin riboside 5'-monophosphate phosphoribohydrolase LOG7 [Hibiscus syriacus]
MEETKSMFKRICVFCGSSSGKKASYQEATVELGKELVERGIDLVYGGGSVGLMGLVSQAVHDGGRHVLGIFFSESSIAAGVSTKPDIMGSNADPVQTRDVIPRTLIPTVIIGEAVGEVRAVSDMHQRRPKWLDRPMPSLRFLVAMAPLKNFWKLLHGRSLGSIVGLLNVDGYYNSLLCFMDKAVDEGFISPTARRIILSAPTAKQLIMQLEEYVSECDEIASKLVWDEVDGLN